MKIPAVKYEASTAVPPSETIKELMEEKGLSQSDLATRSGITQAAISQLLKNQATITDDIALKLERVLSLPAIFWTTRYSRYRQALMRQEQASQVAHDLDWLKEVPIKDLQERGVLEKTTDKVELASKALEFFGVSNAAAFRDTWLRCSVQFRGASATKDRPGYVAAWLRLGELEAEKIPYRPFDKAQFLMALEEIRKLTREAPQLAIREAMVLCAKAGVCVCVVKQIQGASVSGATRWLNGKAVIQLSFKYKTEDIFWFTFIHECCHVLRHGKKLVFLEDGATAYESPEEKEADQFAADFWIPKQYIPTLSRLKSKSAIRQFAHAIGISPGIVVGRMQHEGFLDKSFCNNLKRTIEWD